MIESITIRNFQKHSRFRLELDPEVTCLVGGSDRGKSAVLRALRWLTTNRPAGTAFLQHDKKFVRVEVQVDGQIIVRSRGKRNVYAIGEQEFLAFGASVPPEVQSLLNLDEVNFQSQHDPVFWFSLSPTEVVKQLNAVVDLQSIDRSFAFLSREKHRLTAHVRFCEEDLARTNLQQTALAWTVEAQRELDELDASQMRWIHVSGSRETLRISLLTLRKEQREAQTEEGRSIALKELLRLAKLSKELHDRQRKLEKLISSHRDYQQQIDRAIPPHIFARLAELHERLVIVVEKRSRLTRMIREYRTWEDTRCQSETSSTQNRIEQERLLVGKCPVCRRPFARVP